MRVLSRSDIEKVLDYPSCIAAVEAVFAMRARGESTPSAVLGVHARRGGFHVKAASATIDGKHLFAAKINANFPGNPAQHNLPTIQGMLGLFDAERGEPLALMDSMSVTTIRTAAASAVAARHLALPESSTLAVIGCGIQAHAHVHALRAVRPVERVFAFDVDAGARHAFATEVRRMHSIACMPVGNVAEAVAAAEMVVTCTTAKAPFLDESMLRAGTFVAAVGADNEQKSEIAPSLMKRAGVVVDDLDQCSTIGDLHHAIAAGVMRREDVRAALGDVIIDRSRGRRGPEELIVFDSTGVAIEDVAAAAVAYQRAREQDFGRDVSLGT
jgi:alanine dehydrogenase